MDLTQYWRSILGLVAPFIFWGMILCVARIADWFSVALTKIGMIGDVAILVVPVAASWWLSYRSWRRVRLWYRELKSVVRENPPLTDVAGTPSTGTAVSKTVDSQVAPMGGLE
jgi:hypothetical protein